MTDGIQQDFKIWCQRTFDFMPGKQFFVPNYSVSFQYTLPMTLDIIQGANKKMDPLLQKFTFF